ncbi:MAG: MmgE/PrpD family protein, partial [Pseudomonadales bacterium]|nr:MmgE/PrpD family protein [Pseudomonadales bacterium]
MVEPSVNQLSILQQAAQYLQQVRYEHLPEEAIIVAKQAILDYIGVAVAGSDQPVVNNLRKWAEDCGQLGSVTVIGSSQSLNAEYAALVNAAAGHALDFDDTSWATIGHPSTVILPALFAQSELNAQQGAPVSGKALLLAYIAAVEVCHKIAELMMPLTSQNGWHTTGVFYGFATAAGLCQLQSIDTHTTCMAMALALSNAGGIRSNFGTQAKAYHAGMTVKAGMESFNLAKAGVTASLFALEAEDGFIQCFASAELACNARQRTELVGFGRSYNIVTQG